MPKELKGQNPDFAQKPETRISRSNNPLLEPVPSGLPSWPDHFASIVNKALQEYGGTTPIGKPEIKPFSDGRDQRLYSIVPIPLSTLTPETVSSLRNHLENLWQASAMSYMYESTGFIAVKSWGKPHLDGFYISQPPKFRLPFRKKAEFNERVLEIHNDLQGGLSEAETAYQAVVATLIIDGIIDMSTPDEVEKSKAQRQEIFMRIYHKMLEEMIPPAQREEIFGLDDQIDDVEGNLYTPLKTKKGRPMNTLLVGAPGIGKSLTGRFFAFDNGVISIPTSVKTIDNHSFEYQVLNLSRIQAALDIPVVLILDDIEILLESGLVIDSNGKMAQSVDPEKRSRALNLLERLQDTHKIFLLCTLNHPDVESAFLRRFNPVYFPLPTDEQRQTALGKFIPQGPLSDEEHKEMIGELTSTTEGFNYSGLALIPDYLGNITSRNGQLNPDAFREAMKAAILKASQRTNLQGLREYDQAARKMIDSKI